MVVTLPSTGGSGVDAGSGGAGGESASTSPPRQKARETTRVSSRRTGITTPPRTCWTRRVDVVFFHGKTTIWNSRRSRTFTVLVHSIDPQTLRSVAREDGRVCGNAKIYLRSLSDACCGVFRAGFGVPERRHRRVCRGRGEGKSPGENEVLGDVVLFVFVVFLLLRCWVSHCTGQAVKKVENACAILCGLKAHARKSG